MRGDQRLAAINCIPAISFESVSRIVEIDREKRLDEEIRQAVNKQFQPGIINNSGSPDKPTPENRVVAFV